jgi:hypothetical protein
MKALDSLASKILSVSIKLLHDFHFLVRTELFAHRLFVVLRKAVP